jgi:hypothetical protein
MVAELGLYGRRSAPDPLKLWVGPRRAALRIHGTFARPGCEGQLGPDAGSNPAENGAICRIYVWSKDASPRLLYCYPLYPKWICRIPRKDRLICSPWHQFA